MPQFTCVVGSVNLRASTPIPHLMLAGRSVEDYLSIGAGGGNGSDGPIALRRDDRRTHNEPAGPTAGTGVTAYDLHKKAGDLTGNVTVFHSAGVKRVALLLADHYRPRPNFLGFMFDGGFAVGGMDRSDANLTFMDVPREACAVFLDKIAAIRGLGQAYQDQVSFTAVHELGHLFNLWHVASPESFMVQRTSDAEVFDEYHFAPEHREYLGHCDDDLSVSRYVLPGSARFGLRGPIGQSTPVPPDEDSAEASGLALEVSTSQQEFWHFEPVELEVRVRVTGRRSRRIPDHVDAGYEDFDIWITRPDGHRFQYKSPNHYCGNPETILVEPGRPFERDISIFGQSGGYTFSLAGPHRIQAVFRVTKRTILRSNECVVNVLPFPRPRAQFTAIRETLTSPPVARALYYRTGRVAGKPFDRLMDLCRRERRSPIAASAYYALGRALFRSVREQDTARTATRRREKAVEMLSRASQHPELSPHRRRVAAALLAKAGAPA